MLFTDFLKSRRSELGFSLRHVASRIGVNAAHLSRVESGAAPPSEALIESLSGVLEVPLDELMLVAGRLPESLRRLVERDPYRVASALNRLAALVASESKGHYGAPVFSKPAVRAIEASFPFAEISDIAEVESWRKEVWRPIYHTHKWWAQRLGSVFRATILGCSVPQGSALMDLYSNPVKLPAPVIFDPFMGSGTTVGEAHKLGCTAIGRDINPVAWRVVRTALQPVNKKKLLGLYQELEEKVAPSLLELHRSKDSSGDVCDVLYWFWVKQLACPSCESLVDLFSSRIFAKHAYVKKYPTVRISCPKCGGVFSGDYSSKDASCPECHHSFNPHEGAVKRSKARCANCNQSFVLAKVARSQGQPPGHRLYAKLVLRGDGSKEYLRITEEDVELFDRAASRLEKDNPPMPDVSIKDGHNTRQVLNYGYSRWDQFFNSRQHLGISLLARGISDLPVGPERDALFMLLSGVLEFNNMFASYKGEGTGAVRHMFSHHILKPERTPLEANLWGTRKSSGSFSNLFRLRLLKAVDYKEAPHEVGVELTRTKKKGRKIFGVSPPMGSGILGAWPESGMPPGSIYLSCGDSSSIDIPDRVVDAVVTDPPFYDNVHYSELADFFHVWHRLWFKGDDQESLETTRQTGEVQDADSEQFSDKLKAVFSECCRVLKDDGVLVFSYHHSREDGWSSVASAVLGAGFRFVQAHPVKAEMSVAAPKLAAKSPIDLDVMLVCRKVSSDHRPMMLPEKLWEEVAEAAASKVESFNQSGRSLSLNDVRVVVLSQTLVEASAGQNEDAVRLLLADGVERLRGISEKIFVEQDLTQGYQKRVGAKVPIQGTLF